MSQPAVPCRAERMSHDASAEHAGAGSQLPGDSPSDWTPEERARLKAQRDAEAGQVPAPPPANGCRRCRNPDDLALARLPGCPPDSNHDLFCPDCVQEGVQKVGGMGEKAAFLSWMWCPICSRQ